MKIQVAPKPYTNFRSLKPKSVSSNNITPQNPKHQEKTSRINYRALLLAGLIAMSPLTLMGCNNASKTSIEQEANNYSENINETLELQDRLIEEGDKLTIDSCKEILNEFFAQNSIDNITIEDTNNPKDENIVEILKGKNAAAMFFPQHNEEKKYIGGILYINESAKLNTLKQRANFIDIVSHEATHIIQAKNNADNKIGIKDERLDYEESVSITVFLNELINYSTPLQIFQSSVQSGGAIKYCEENLSEKEYQKIIEETEEYGTVISTKPITIDDELIKDGFCELVDTYSAYVDIGNGGDTFEEKINTYIDYMLEQYGELFPYDESREDIIKEAILCELIQTYEFEAEGYKSGNIALKKALRADENQEILKDIVSRTHSLVADVLKEKLEREYR